MLHQKINMTVFYQNVTNGLKFWWNVVISQVSLVTFEIFRWSMVTSQIFVEHGRFSNFVGTWLFLFLFGGAWSLFKFFDGAWSLVKFLWSMVVSQILVEHCHFYFFWWSMVLSQIFWHQSYHYHYIVTDML